MSKNEKLFLYEIDNSYIKRLNEVEPKVFYNHGKHNRPFVGVLLTFNSQQYFAPLSSPKKKHEYMRESLTFCKIEEKDKLIAVINLNNMIPAPNPIVKKVGNIKFNDKQYFNLLMTQQRSINANNNNKAIRKKAKKLLHLYTHNLLPNKVKKLCNDFNKLNYVSNKYVKQVKYYKYKNIGRQFE